MDKAWFEDYEVPMALPTIELGPMDRFDYIPIALILRDTNPLHLDRVYAQERGLPDVVQQGPLNQAYLYRYFTSLLHDPWDLVATKMRFAANVFPDDILTCGGEVLAAAPMEAGGGIVTCAVWQRNQKGETILKGEAKARIPSGD
ncbi:MAG: MaoC family dehydratase [Pseudomonadota bacterium]|nr:MaoC family dehydratase [Pseudomonadota bacterium]